MKALAPDEIVNALGRHLACDWGDVDDEDWLTNNQARLSGGRLLSAYRSETGEKFWIITEWDFSATTCLLPEEY